jgi:hypothetical protein
VCFKFWSENQKTRDQTEDRGVDLRIILKRIHNSDGGMKTGFILLRVWTSEHFNETQDSIKG